MKPMAKISIFVLRCLAVMVLSLAGYHLANAQTSENIFLGGVHWTVPKPYIYAQSTNTDKLHFISLQFALPSFGPKNPIGFPEAYPEDSQPVLTVTITDDKSLIAGQAWLNQLMAEAETNCPICISDSSLGGKVYTNYKMRASAFENTHYGIPFNLYVNSSQANDWFSVCYFKPDLAPLPCEAREPFGNDLTIDYKFPPEYLSQATWIDSRIKIVLAQFQDSSASILPEELNLLNLKPSCWSPEPGSAGAKTIDLQVGPELWHIPQAYGATFGSNQTQNPNVNGFDVYLKLPDLEPLNTTDLSPFEMHGYGKYINITVTYDTEALYKHLTPSIRSGSLPTLDMPDARYIGQNSFIDFAEISAFVSSNKYLFLPISEIFFISENPSTSASSFPPWVFSCRQFSPGENAGCDFEVVRPLLSKSIAYPNAGYKISYQLSRDYFSEIIPISKCVQNLFDLFSTQIN